MELHVELESSLGNVNDSPNGLAIVSGESHFEVIVVVVVILPIQCLLFKKPLPLAITCQAEETHFPSLS